MAANMAITPPNLLGIERRIAYAHRKYHSGLICAGVTSGFAGKKLSGSPNIAGQNKVMASKVRVIKMNPAISFTV